MDLNSEDDMSSGRESDMDISNFNESLYEKRRRSMRLTKKQNNLRGRHTNANVQKDNVSLNNRIS